MLEINKKTMNWKEQAIQIFKLILAYRRDPYLQFSGLLVTSGCVLLSNNILEIIINLIFRIFIQEEKNIQISNNIAPVIGVILIVFGILLFYFKFLKKKALSKEYKKDSEVIKKIFLEITSLDELDFFIDKALYPYLVDTVLSQFEQFEIYKNSSYYHVYDEELEKHIEDFYLPWQSIYYQYQAFTPTRNENILRPNTVMDLAMTEDVQKAIDEVPKCAQLMHKNLKKLLKYIRSSFKDIEI
jgi:hypothetical protein